MPNSAGARTPIAHLPARASVARPVSRRSRHVHEIRDTRVAMARADVDSFADQDRASCAKKVVDDAIGSVVRYCGASQQLSDAEAVRAVCVTRAVLDDDDRVTVGVAERALSLIVGISGKRSGTLAAHARSACVTPNRRARFDGSGEPAGVLVANVVHVVANQQPDVPGRNARGGQGTYGAPGKSPIGVCGARRGCAPERGCAAARHDKHRTPGPHGHAARYAAEKNSEAGPVPA
jgi:hypothetical protein